MVEKREAELKAQFSKELKRQLPSFIVLLQASNGAADRAIVGHKFTSFWEFKHATPDFDAPGNQVLMCCRLARAGYCRFVIWWESATGEGQRTMIVHPENVKARIGWHTTHETETEGFDHVWLVEQIKKVHGLI